MKNDDGALSFGTSVDLRGLETGISQIEAKIATMEGKLGAKIDGIGKAVSRSGITAKSTLEDVTNACNVLDGTLGNVAKTAASIGMAFTRLRRNRCQWHLLPRIPEYCPADPEYYRKKLFPSLS